MQLHLKNLLAGSRGAVLALAVLVAACAPMETGTRAEDCGSCHTTQHAEWSASPHANSKRSQVFNALLPKVEAAWGKVARTRCEACHSPGHGGDDTIGCVSCHAAVGNRAERDGQLVVDVNAPLAGPTAPAEAPHAVTRRGLLASATLCGTCHEVHGPRLLVEQTLTEFRAAGVDEASCATCHQPNGAEHRFEGFTAPLLQKALKLELTIDADAAVVSLTNAGAAHAVPTGIALVRDLWVELSVDGAPLATRALALDARLTRDGAEVPLFTDADAVEPRSLAPGEQRTERVTLPSSGHAVTARLYAAPVRADVLEALGLEPSGPFLVSQAVRQR